MNSNNKNWIPYLLEEVVDTNDAKMSVRNYIEQRDLRNYLISLNNNNFDKAVEFGCGYGRMTMVLTEFSSNVIGVEREELFINKASRLVPNITFYQADDLSSVPIDSNSADLIISYTFLQHLINPQAIKVTNEMLRCLTDDGHILICEETDENHIFGDINDPMGRCTIGRSIETYCELFSPLNLKSSAARKIEPGYSRKNVGNYMLFENPSKFIDCEKKNLNP